MKYKNFDIELYEYQERDGRESYSVRVTNSPAGDQSPSQAERVTLPEGFRSRSAEVQRYCLAGLDEAIDLGEELGEQLLPVSRRKIWFGSVQSLREDEALRLRLKFDAWQLADLPWEYIYVGRAPATGGKKGGDGFLALDRRVSIVRYEYTDCPFVPFEAHDDVAIRLLVLSSSPIDVAPLDLASVTRAIAHSLRSVTNLTVEFLENPTVAALQEALEHRTGILHLAGHGAFERRVGKELDSWKGKGEFILCGPNGRAMRFPTDELALKLVRCGVRIVFLNSACSASRDSSHRLSGLAATLAHAGVPAVIGFNGVVSDSAAVLFSMTLYRDLAAGNPLDTAVTNARLALFNQGGPFWCTPVLYLRSDDSTPFPIRPRLPNPSDLPLRQMLVQSFNVDELQLLCADITDAFARDRVQQRVDLEIVGGSTLEMYALNLVRHLERRGLLSYLVEAMRAARPILFPAAKG